MDGIAGRSLLLGSLFAGAALCVGSAAVAHYLTSTRPAVSAEMPTAGPTRYPASPAFPREPELTTSSIGRVERPLSLTPPAVPAMPQARR